MPRSKTAEILGVAVHPLRQLADGRGSVMRMLRRDDPWFSRFGEIYFSTVHPQVVKGWHLHKAMTLNYAVVCGRIRLALYDERPRSPTRGLTQELVLGSGPEEYKLVTVPPGVWNGFQGLGDSVSTVANCATLPHDPREIVRIDPFSDKIPFDWGRDALKQK